MLSTSRRLRAEQTRARLQALGPRWVPTPEVVADELRRIEGGLPGDPEPAPAAPGVDWVPERRRLPALLVLLAGGLVGSAAVWLLAVPRGEVVPGLTVSPAGTSTVASLAPEPVSAPAASQTPGGPAPSTVADASEGAVSRAGTAGVVVVDVQGAVRHAGVVELPAGSRVVDALAAAGGATRHAVTRTLNLAQVLVDGTQVLVPDRRSRAAPPAATATGAAVTSSVPGTPVDLNTATLEQLDALPGIGPVLAQRILDYRAEHGPFTAVDQLTEVSGIGEATLADLIPLVRV